MRIMEFLDFSGDAKAICRFVQTVKSTCGGDYPEAYELALRKAQTLSWNPRHAKALVMVRTSDHKRLRKRCARI